jgi:hypothetical protein
MKIVRRWAAGAALFVGLVVTGAQAMPIAPPAAIGDAASIIAVRDGCGPFGHRSHYGFCKPNGYGPGPGFGPGPVYGFYGPPRFDRPPPPRCVVRETYYGPRRFCR